MGEPQGKRLKNHKQMFLEKKQFSYQICLGQTCKMPALLCD